MPAITSTAPPANAVMAGPRKEELAGWRKIIRKTEAKKGYSDATTDKCTKETLL